MTTPHASDANKKPGDARRAFAPQQIPADEGFLLKLRNLTTRQAGAAAVRAGIVSRRGKLAKIFR